MAELEPVHLTQFAKRAGCAAKQPPDYLLSLLSTLPVITDPNVIVGHATADDAAVYRISDDLALIFTTDFFTPIVDKPYDFGAIAAANALSDVYAMAGVPLMALSLVGFPSGALPPEVLAEVLRGLPTPAFDGYKPPSVLQVPGAKDVAVEFFTMSKSYNMPGWRVGFMVGNPVLVSALARLKSYFDYGTFTPIQVASIAALEGPQECVHEICETYRKRRDVLVEGLNKMGWPVALPKATMLCGRRFPPIPEDGVAGDFEAVAHGGEDGCVARDWVWRLRGRACAVFAD